MSKARWQQFGVSQLDDIASQASAGAQTPHTISVFKNPLRAYQTVFSKALRLIGECTGHNTEARYFNEANWCRLYKRELWDGIRFPEGMYAQDVMAAGQLYARMDKVADVDCVLYYWLQSASSVTHKERSFSFYHDNAAAGITNSEYALDHGMLPARSYYTMTTQLEESKHVLDPLSEEDNSLYEKDKNVVSALIKKMNFFQKLLCLLLGKIRLLEKHLRP